MDVGDGIGVLGLALVSSALWSWWGWEAAAAWCGGLIMVVYVAREIRGAA